ncbi:MAG: hypothetical protein JO046_05985 [Solirubrobacterales bacterium]|nr:hypothetical protein [Solirubrobacterales bacterium]
MFDTARIGRNQRRLERDVRFLTDGAERVLGLLARASGGLVSAVSYLPLLGGQVADVRFQKPHSPSIARLGSRASALPPETKRTHHAFRFVGLLEGIRDPHRLCEKSIASLDRIVARPADHVRHEIR